jgi:malonyl CoA-acyl carrier protein transacylase
VAVASLTSRVARAVAPFRAVIASHEPKVPDRSRFLLSGRGGSAVLGTAGAADKLARQLGNAVHWEAGLDAAAGRGASLFLELGPVAPSGLA